MIACDCESSLRCRAPSVISRDYSWCLQMDEKAPPLKPYIVKRTLCFLQTSSSNQRGAHSHITKAWAGRTALGKNTNITRLLKTTQLSSLVWRLLWIFWITPVICTLIFNSFTDLYFISVLQGIVYAIHPRFIKKQSLEKNPTESSIFSPLFTDLIISLTRCSCHHCYQKRITKKMQEHF